MDKKILDALMIDRALGALSPDTEALLDAYLFQHPESTKHLDCTMETVDLLKGALKQKAYSALPDFNAPVLVSKRRWRRCAFQVAGMAATLAIGLFFGRLHMERSTSVTPSSVVAVVEAAPAPQTDAGIWSMARKRRSKRATRSSNWEWHSPVQQPRYIHKGDA
jgi:anti-sigma factor RsiW